MPAKKNNIKITNQDIKYAENILLKNGQNFDIERRDFIKNLDTIDLEAVPWSWKTTALLAKLVILAKKMPFEDGNGILVLSHTNTAVDEIKNKLGKITPKLFTFPNFIGTIQSFVNEFLTKPYWLSFLWINFNQIDTEYYNLKNHIEYHTLPHKVKLYLKNRHDPLLTFQKVIINNNGDLLKDSFWEILLKKKEASDSYQKIFEIKNRLRQDWIISFDEAYHLAFCYLKEFPKIIKILQKRFGYVFVDEMQDMEKHQVNILENLFYKKHTFNHCFQRIWDKNQAIYSNTNSVERDRTEGAPRKILQIQWSHRLTRSISKVVNCFWVEWEAKIIWKNILEMWDIKPTMIIYEEKHLNTETWWENKILRQFWKIIEEKKENWYFQEIPDKKFICKAILSNAVTHNDGFKIDKCRAKHYFFEYDDNFQKRKTSWWLKSEKDYLYYYNKNDASYHSKYKNILKLLFRILKKENIQRYNRKEELFKYLWENFPEKLLELKDNLLSFCKNLNDRNIDTLAQEMDIYFKKFIKEIWGKNITPWIYNSPISKETQILNNNEETNTFNYNWIKIQVGTTHSVKWETHTCTLYMESSYKSYEIEQIWWDLFLWRSKKLTWKKLTWKKFSKLVYVWFSRPTHLLCFAIWKKRFDKAFKTEKDITELKNFWDLEQIKV